MEKWKPLAGYEKLYEISDLGRMRGLGRSGLDRFGAKLNHKPRMLKPLINGRGYVQVALSHLGKQRMALVHRLVAKHFLPPSSLPIVNHIDHDKTNNAATNLEWTDQGGNLRHASANGRLVRKLQSASVIAIVRQLQSEDGFTDEEIAMTLGISVRAVRSVR